MTLQTFENLLSHMRLLATVAAEGGAYESWSDDLARKECREAWTGSGGPLRRQRQCVVTARALRALSDNELLMLGFARWSADKADPMWLIPLWLYPCLQSGIDIESIMGDQTQTGAADVDLDHRGGCLAYGFRHR